MNEVLKSNYPEADEFLSKMKVQFHKHFPNACFEAKASKSLGAPHMVIYMRLVLDKNELSSGYADNDPMFTSIIIHSNGDDFNGDRLEMEALRSGLSTNPPKGSHYAMGRVKTAIRKSTGNLTKQERALTNYFKKLAKIIIENKEDIFNIEKYSEKYLDVRS